MDRVDLASLRAEMLADTGVFVNAIEQASIRFGSGTDQELESAAFHLTRGYNALEQMAVRVARRFENHIEDERSWHAGIVRRMSLEIPGVRPRLFPPELCADIHDLRAFRHVVVHAYDLKLRADKMKMVLCSANKVSAALPQLVDAFLREIEAALA